MLWLTFDKSSLLSFGVKANFEGVVVATVDLLLFTNLLFVYINALSQIITQQQWQLFF